MTSLIVVTGFALPIVLAHSGVIDSRASAMSIVGGGYVHPFPSAATPNPRLVLAGWYMAPFSLIPPLSTRPNQITISLVCNDAVVDAILNFR